MGACIHSREFNAPLRMHLCLCKAMDCSACRGQSLAWWLRRGCEALFVLFLHIACGRTISSMEFRFSMATSRRSPRITATSPRIPRATAISRRSPRITTTNPRILTMTFRKNYLIYLVTMINWLLMVLKAQIFLKNSAQPRVLKVMNPH